MPNEVKAIELPSIQSGAIWVKESPVTPQERCRSSSSSTAWAIPSMFCWVPEGRNGNAESIQR